MNKSNYDRELQGLIHAMEKLDIYKGYIVTFDSEEKKIDKNIFVMPFWKLFFKKGV